MKERNHGIDLLRLVSMYMVCVLHTLGHGGVLSILEKGTIKYSVFWFLEILCYCAVDIFAIISGYTASEKNRKYEKLVNMWFQVFFYSFIITGLFVIAGIKAEWGWKEIIKAAFPVTFNRYWYFTAFFGLYFAIPVINKFFFSIDKITAKKIIIIIFILFSLLETIGGTFRTQAGYSVTWLIILYCIGILIKRTGMFENKKTIVLIALWALCIFFTWGVLVFADKDILVSYVSPTILLSGLIMVVLFSRIRLNGKIISKLSPLAFGIYLFHKSEVIWWTYLKDAFAFVLTKKVVVGTVYVLAGAFIIFVCGLIVEFLRSYIAKKINISKLSALIVKGVDHIINKLLVFLK